MRWFSPSERDAYRRRMELERAGTELIKAADRLRRRQQHESAAPKAVKLEATSSIPGRFTLSDLPMLRRRGLVP
jgi:hypothetical protein